jgi:hypothetical protein
MPKNYKLGYLEQHINFIQNTVIDEACLALADRFLEVFVSNIFSPACSHQLWYYRIKKNLSSKYLPLIFGRNMEICGGMVEVLQRQVKRMRD